MPRVLLTAFGPYSRWKDNASWLALVDLTQDLPATPQVTTRLYPVDYMLVRDRLEKDLVDAYDYAILVGQAPGAAGIQLEAIGTNIGLSESKHPDHCLTLIEDGPVAYRSKFPLTEWAEHLRQEDIPTRVSYHAGSYLCNAVLYLAHYFCERHQLPTHVTFIHVPLTPTQVVNSHDDLPSMPTRTASRAIRLIIEQLAAYSV